MGRKSDFPSGWGEEDIGDVMGLEKLRKEKKAKKLEERAEIIENTKTVPGLRTNSLMTPERVDKILQAVKIGGTLKVAAEYAGISQRTLYNWIERGEEEPDSPYGDFLVKYRQSEGSNALRSLAQIEEAAKDGDWRAAAWKLERRYPHEYGKTVSEQKVDVRAAVAPVDIKALAELSPEQLEALAGDMTEVIGDE